MKFQMKNFILAIMLVAIGTVSCSSCTKETTTPDAGSPPVPSSSTTVTPEPPKPVPGPVTIKEGKWEFTFPTDGWKRVENPPPHSIAFINQEVKNITIMVDEEFTGTYDEYALNAIRGIRAAGATVASAKQVEINGTKFVLVDSSKDGMRVWLWVTLKGGRGNALSCGGGDTTSTHDLCFGIANTLKIN